VEGKVIEDEEGLENMMAHLNEEGRDEIVVVILLAGNV
jgi:hypothetical protein